MRNILVTGGAGFIGSNFIRFLLAKEAPLNIYNLDLLTYAGSLENLKDLPEDGRHHFIQGDICDSDLVKNLMKEIDFDTVVHFAAESHVDRSIFNPGQFIQTNIVGTFNLLEAARTVWLAEPAVLNNKRFHHVSTDEVFGALQPGDPAFNENTPYSPRSPYSASKASSDHLVRAYYHTYHLPVTISNCTNNYGPYQFPEKLIPLMILNALEGKPLPVYGDGLQVRDWLYVEDHCEAIYRILQNGKIGQTYAIGGNNQPGNIEIIETICAILDQLQPDSIHVPHNKLIKYVTDRPGHDRRYAMNIDFIHQELGWSPAKDLKSGLYETVLWYLNHPDWVGAIRNRGDYAQWMQSNYTRR
ncbi:MAG: dTDP-glucose 4,6-dehydratase [Anaerolineae bacterium]|nr:dTDP-glucose 4,6-dehydratase [Anaerolineae bacterium]